MNNSNDDSLDRLREILFGPKGTTTAPPADDTVTAPAEDDVEWDFRIIDLKDLPLFTGEESATEDVYGVLKNDPPIHAVNFDSEIILTTDEMLAALAAIETMGDTDRTLGDVADFDVPLVREVVIGDSEKYYGSVRKHRGEWVYCKDRSS